MLYYTDSSRLVAAILRILCLLPLDACSYLCIKWRATPIISAASANVMSVYRIYETENGAFRGNCDDRARDNKASRSLSPI
jgi:hypothetical protein